MNREKKNIYIMYLIIFLQGLVFYGAIATVYRQSRGLSMAQIFLLESISYIVVILLEVPWGWLGDKFGYRKVLVISNLIFFISKIVFLEANSLEMFLLERILISVALSGLSGCDTAYIYTAIEDKEISEKVFSRYNLWGTIGYLLGCFGSSFLLKISMESTVWATVISYGMAFVLSLFLSETKSEEYKKPSIVSSIRLVLKNRIFILFILSFAIITEVNQSITVFLNQTQYSNCGIDISLFGIILTIGQCLSIFTGKAYILTEKIGRNKAIIGLYGMMMLASLILAMTSNGIVSIASVYIVTLSFALLTPMAIDMENKSIVEGDRATILSIYSMISSMVSAIINPVTGGIADNSLKLTFLFCFIIMIIAILMVVFYFKFSKRYEVVEA